MAQPKPKPPSGTHPSSSPALVAKPATPHTPGDKPASNIHGSPNPPSGKHSPSNTP